jgi:ABC-type branched-subunit amino acid transport system ATPase component
MTALLSLENVSAGYVADIDILRGIDVSIAPGAITGLIGLNGAGKSTIMKTICGFLAPSAGTIRFDGKDITAIAPHQVIDLGISYIPQESSLFNYMSVENNLTLPLEHLARRNIGLTKANLAGRLDDCFAKFPLLRERRRAKAYLQRPRLCLIDEPGIGLAPKVAEEVYQWIGLFAAEKMAILLVDHNVRRVVKMSSYIYVLSLGEITAKGKPEDFAGDLHDQVKSWLGINF